MQSPNYGLVDGKVKACYLNITPSLLTRDYYEGYYNAERRNLTFVFLKWVEANQIRP